MMKFNVATLIARLAAVTFIAILVCDGAFAQESFDPKAKARVVYGDTDQCHEEGQKRNIFEKPIEPWLMLACSSF